MIRRAVSLFSNCGAGDVGYRKAGFTFEVMAELDTRRLEVCLQNHPEASGVIGDLRETWQKVVAGYRRRNGNKRLHLLAACPPCQGMSSARSGRGKESDADAGSKDSRNLLVTVVIEVAKALTPDLIVLENVPAFLTRKIRHPKTGRPIAAAKLLIEHLSSSYDVYPVLLDLCDFGVPQTRKRTFITLVRKTLRSATTLRKRKSLPYPIPRFASDFRGRPVSVKSLLERIALPSLDAASPETAIAHGWGDLHAVPIWQDRRYPMVAAIPPHTGKGAWQNNTCEKCGKVDVLEDDVFCPSCRSPLLRPVVKDKKGWRLVSGFRNTSYTRMASAEPACTITTASGHIGSDHTIHPWENRLLSTLECARLQTFPSKFKWGKALERYGHTNVREMIGEAVPPLFTRKHGEVLMELLRGKLRKTLLSLDNQRSLNARKKLGINEKAKPTASKKKVRRR